ncbi:NTP transferase domain-containing protein [Streptomyces sp. NPDC085946]|uniref:NTP transferase domain-containing protein n=1 Tax=Streptomyces sp. NPDC085946 TaxID=3365744 RepID=UPI0037D3A8FE
MTSYEPTGAPAAGTGRARGGGHAVYDAVVLAGGAARRLGGADKPGVRVGGRALLDRVLDACSGAGTTVVVADPRPTARPVTWAREEPPGGGPVAALDAGLRHTTAEHVVVLSADLPFLGGPVVERLLTTLRTSGTDGVLLADADGRDQPLVAAYRASALRRALAGLTGVSSGSPFTGAPAGSSPASGVPAAGTPPVDAPPGGPSASPTEVLPADAPPGSRSAAAAPTGRSAAPTSGSGTAGAGSLAGMPLRRLVAALALTRIFDPVASFDCDTWDDIATARSRIREHGHVLDEWITAAKDELGIELDVDTGVLLDLARDAAHGVARPAAPLTTFLVGYAAAQAGGGPEAVAEAARKAGALALRWAEEDTADASPAAPGPAAPRPTGASPADASPTDASPAAPPPAVPPAGAQPDVAPDATPDTRPDAG